MRILGIDPGTQVVGYGLIEVQGGRLRALDFGAVRARGDALPDRLVQVYEGLSDALERLRPDVVAIEDVFHGKNFQSAVRLGEGRGVALLCAARAGVEIAEYAPAMIKKAVVGWGRADKAQVQRMVQAVLRMAAPPTPKDAADALAVAICHGNRLRMDRLLARG